jgi:hypothetical protein
MTQVRRLWFAAEPRFDALCNVYGHRSGISLIAMQGQAINSWLRRQNQFVNHGWTHPRQPQQKMADGRWQNRPLCSHKMFAHASKTLRHSITHEHG